MSKDHYTAIVDIKRVSFQQDRVLASEGKSVDDTLHIVVRAETLEGAVEKLRKHLSVHLGQETA